MKQKTSVALMIVLSTITAACMTSPSGSPKGRVCFNGSCFEVELARTNLERARGLMYRENLNADSGMLFVFEEEGVYPFWMKNTLIPLDIIWINQSHDIVYISRNTMPCETDACPSVNPGVKAMYVLEVNGGLSEELNLSSGDRVSITLE